MDNLEELFRASVPKPGCPGWRIDQEGQEWYSAAWIDRHSEVIDLDELPLRESASEQSCEFDCQSPADVYGGFLGADQWAGWACLEHAAQPGFQIWERR